MESIPMLGRGGELAELRRAWERVEGGTAAGPIVATITGPPGTGKSRLVTAAVAEMSPGAVHVGAARLHSPAPYDWLAAILTHCGGDEQWEISVPADALAWLRQDVGVVRERFAPEALLRIAVRVVRALVGAGPVVLVVEDLHALDPASLNLLAALATTPLPALLLVTSLPASTPMVAATLSRLHGSPGAVRQHLGPLDREDVAAALVATYGDHARGAIEPVWQRTGGNPYELTELLAITPDPAVLLATQTDLTAREIDVLACLADGMSNQQVASHLGISIRTVTVHVSNLLRKTQCRSRTDAALWAVRHSYSSATTTSS